MQRKQSLWLFLSALVILLTFFMPYGIHSSSEVTTSVVTESNMTAKSNVLLAILTSLSAALALFVIFLHANRKLQRKLTLLTIILCLATAGYMFYDANLSGPANKLALGILGSSIYLGILFPLLASGLAIMAFLGIRKDEKLIQSMDRLR
jgi:Domain of unknown function (DUF4293)